MVQNITDRLPYLSLVPQISQALKLKPNLYTSGCHPDMIQTWLFACSRKIKISCWAFLDGHPVKIMKLSHHDMNQKCKTDQTNHIYFLQDLTQMCTQKYNQKCSQLLNFSLQTKSRFWFISLRCLDAYSLGLRVETWNVMGKLSEGHLLWSF